MYITSEELMNYHRDGYLLKSVCFSREEIAILKSQLNVVFLEDAPSRILEKNGIVRSVYGVHTTNDIFAALVRHPKLLQPAIEILQSGVYVYQFKINAKAAMGGDVWEWHQDFIFWNKEDGLPGPNLVNMAIFLDDVTEFNGPLMIIPGSHKPGMVNIEPRTQGETSDGDPEWITNLTSDLKYSLNREVIASLASSNGIVAPKGPAGSVLLFDPNVFHGSASNMSPVNRAVVIVTYNSVENLPKPIKNLRPEFLVSRDSRPLEALPENCLLLRS